MPSLFNSELEKISLEHEEKNSEFLTMHWRPITSDKNYSIADKKVPKKICIVMQGSLLNFKNFTFETIKLYNKIFPDVDIILSTWMDGEKVILEDLKALKVIILLNEKPAFSGLSNVNLQITSTKAGLQHAFEEKYQYVLKTRTDCRIYAPDFFIHAFDLLESYPLEKEISVIQKERLLSISEGNKYALYVVPDKNMFGNVEDMVKYWSPPLDLRGTAPPSNLKSMAEHGIAESYFIKNYLTSLNLNFAYTLTCYWQIMSKHFIVMDWHSADIYWCKYNRYREFKGTHYFGPSSFDSFGFKDWLRVYRDISPLNGNESIILRQHGAILSDIEGFN